ncbi:MAG: hypothetical protein ACO1NW_16960 [Chitinophagaceae bacterium]
MMQTAVDEMVYRLLRKKSLAETSVQQLEDLVKDYPYFPLTRFLLARKALENNLPQSNEQQKMAAVYMPDVHWLQYVLHDGIAYNEGAVAEEAEEEEEYGENEATAFREETITEENPTSIQEEYDLQQPAWTEATIQDEPEEPVLDEEELVAAPEAMEVPLPTDEGLDQTIAELKAGPAKNTVPEETAIPLDPYHSIDYFASQGIQLRNDDLNKDQMGRQLKKFTEWLKTMKRIPASESAADIDDATNQNIQNIAAHSITGTEITTEAMADVLVKQKRYDRAIEMYRKLSLQNPAKSTYFASLIEDLNKLLS